jgi:rhodanese-related sulfurtransferase
VDYAFWGLIAVFLLVVFLPRILAAKYRIKGPAARSKVEAGAQLVDVRSPGEFASGHIDGALNIPVGSLAARVGELEKERPVVVYCASGMRSASAARRLASDGFEVYDLGSMGAW